MTGTQRQRRTAPRVAAGAVAALAGGVTPGTAYAAGSGDITADILANRNVTLTGDAVVKVPSGTHTYTGVIAAPEPSPYAGPGRLVLAKDSDFTIPRARQRQSVKTLGGNHPWTEVSDPDPPAVIVDRGATLQYGTGAAAPG